MRDAGDPHPEVTEPVFEEKFSPAGHVSSVLFTGDRKPGSSLGYAYVDFQHGEHGGALFHTLSTFSHQFMVYMWNLGIIVVLHHVDQVTSCWFESSELRLLPTINALSSLLEAHRTLY